MSKLVTTVALATLLAVGSNAVAFARAADIIAAERARVSLGSPQANVPVGPTTRQDVVSDPNQASQAYTTQNAVPNAGSSAHR
jgi:hypothetical protein